jgi:hypothetical protein
VRAHAHLPRVVPLGLQHLDHAVLALQLPHHAGQLLHHPVLLLHNHLVVGGALVQLARLGRALRQLRLRVRQLRP